MPCSLFTPLYTSKGHCISNLNSFVNVLKLCVTIVIDTILKQTTTKTFLYMSFGLLAKNFIPKFRKHKDEMPNNRIETGHHFMKSISIDTSSPF